MKIDNTSMQPVKPIEPTAPPGGNIENRQPPSKPSSPGQKIGQDRTDISGLGRLFEVVERQSNEMQPVLKAFDEQIHKNLLSGNFDVEKIVQDTPTELLQLAEENGINLSDALNEFFEKMPKPTQ